MVDLNKLKVSLTKHGAHKVAALLVDFDASHILGKIGEDYHKVQARKTLSATGGVVPTFWDDARARGPETLNGLVLIGLIFSHHLLIKAMAESSLPGVQFQGKFVRGQHLVAKYFTNFSGSLHELGYATAATQDYVHYDLQRLFKISGLNVLAIKLLALKLKTAGWDGKGSEIEEILRHDFHRVFSLPPALFERWLRTGNFSSADDADLSFFEDASDAPTYGGFVFKSGHNKKKTGKVGVAESKAPKTADLLHNQMQNELFDSLVDTYGEKCVGTEIPTGAETSIDIVVKTEKFCALYEIKTADTVKACIRQALPQLLEYAYWRGKAEGIDQLIIVGPAAMTPEAERYLNLLNTQFGIPVEYQQWSKAVVLIAA